MATTRKQPPTRGDASMVTVVATTLAALTTTPADAAAVQLARRYAVAMDDAVTLAERLDGLDMREADVPLQRLVTALQSQVEARNTLSDIGPKLLAVLKELKATPAARSAGGVATPPAGPAKPADPLADLRAQAAARRASRTAIQ